MYNANVITHSYVRKFKFYGFPARTISMLVSAVSLAIDVINVIQMRFSVAFIDEFQNYYRKDLLLKKIHILINYVLVTS